MLRWEELLAFGKLCPSVPWQEWMDRVVKKKARVHVIGYSNTKILVISMIVVGIAVCLFLGLVAYRQWQLQLGLEAHSEVIVAHTEALQAFVKENQAFKSMFIPDGTAEIPEKIEAKNVGGP